MKPTAFGVVGIGIRFELETILRLPLIRTFIRAIHQDDIIVAAVEAITAPVLNLRVAFILSVRDGLCVRYGNQLDPLATACGSDPGNLSLANSHLLKSGQLICPYILFVGY